MKVAHNDETNPNTQPVRPPHIPSIGHTQLSPSGSSVRKRETLGILSRMFPPFAGTAYYRVRSHLAPFIAMSCISLHCIYCFFPLFFPETSRLTPLLLPRSTTVSTTRPSLPSFHASKPPLINQISPTLFSLILALGLQPLMIR